jgi:hypothetical protein
LHEFVQSNEETSDQGAQRAEIDADRSVRTIITAMSSLSFGGHVDMPGVHKITPRADGFATA